MESKFLAFCSQQAFELALTRLVLGGVVVVEARQINKKVWIIQTAF